MSSILEFGLAVVQSLGEVWGRGGAASPQSDGRAPWAGFNWAGIRTLVVLSGFTRKSLERQEKGNQGVFPTSWL